MELILPAAQKWGRECRVEPSRTVNTRQIRGLAENPLVENLDTTGLPIVFVDFPNVRASEGCSEKHQETSHLEKMQGRLNWGSFGRLNEISFTQIMVVQ